MEEGKFLNKPWITNLLAEEDDPVNDDEMEINKNVKFNIF